MTRPRLDLVAEQPAARDLVVLAHGGQEHSLEEPHDWRHAILRMWPCENDEFLPNDSRKQTAAGLARAG